MAETTRTNFFHRGWTNFSRQFNAASIDMRFNFSEEQRTTSPSRHAILIFTVSVIINLQQLKFQRKKQTPFETYPKTMGVVITCLLLYCILSEAKLRFSSPIYASIVHHVMTLFDFLSLTFLASTLFPDSIMPVLYVVFIMLSTGELRQLLRWTEMGEPGESGFYGRSIERHLIDSYRHRAHAFMSERNILPV